MSAAAPDTDRFPGNTAHPAVVTEETLFAMTGYKRSGDLRTYLTEKRIPFQVGKQGRVWTTTDALNKGLGVSNTTPEIVF
ncbi:MAG: DUF4224 domain-containing protein [Gammaproteobacteria bacterium]|nr:DUF4224 domain-containing protein [Gammaproteobacteria bacterium]